MSDDEEIEEIEEDKEWKKIQEGARRLVRLSHTNPVAYSRKIQTMPSVAKEWLKDIPNTKDLAGKKKYVSKNNVADVIQECEIVVRRTLTNLRGEHEILSDGIS